MRIVVALGGNALLRRGEIADAEPQRQNVARATAALAGLAREHEVVLTHGNGPQVGVLALESATNPTLTRPYPFDVIGAETQGMIGYWIAQETRNILRDREVVSLVTQVVVDAGDAAFANPTKFVGPVYSQAEASALADRFGWQVRRDGEHWRRVVPSPVPLRIVELSVIRLLVDAGVIVISSGGGGVPVVEDPEGRLIGVEAVIDKDLAAAVLAESVKADMLVLLTDVTHVQRGFGTPQAEPIKMATPELLAALDFPAGSMGPKIDAVRQFVERTGGRAAIGALDDAAAIVAGQAGTQVQPSSN